MIIGIIAVVLALLAVWVVNTRRSLAAMDENIDNTMNQIGVQLSSCFDALITLLGRKGFQVRELAPGTPPGACRQTLVYAWRKEQYWLPAVVKQYGIDMDLYVDGQYRANASFEPTRNLVSPHVKFVRFTRYLGRVLDRLFPGRPEVGA